MRAVEAGVPITDASYYRAITEEQFDHIFSRCEDRGVIPLKEQRLAILRETGSVLCERFNSSFWSFVVGLGDRSVDTFLKSLLTYFPSFRDVHTYEGQTGKFGHLLLHSKPQLFSVEILQPIGAS